jgi:DNA-binding CsgD family transcriptional regulator
MSAAAPIQAGSGEIQIETMCSTLDSIGVALLIVDPAARVRSCNDVARRLIAGGFLRLQTDRLLGQVRADSARLHGAIEAVTRSPKAPPRTVALEGLDGAAGRSATIAPACCPEGEPMALIALTAPCTTIAPDRLRRAFGLTLAETRLLSALVTGERLAEYAERTGVKRSTAKTHLRGLFNKVGESRQADLIRRVMDDALLRSPWDSAAAA